MTEAFHGLRIGPPPYTDSERYRLIVSRSIIAGSATCKADFDEQINKVGDIEEANRIIDLTDKRPGCSARIENFRFECGCGSTWNFNQEPPACQAR